jgi:glycerol-3-phosphate acyltransferase PlsY
MTVNCEQSMKREDQQDATIRCLLLTSVSTCFGHHYAHLYENKGPVTAFGVLFWFCWMWLVAVVGCCIVLVLLDVVGRGCGVLYCSGSAGCGW